MVIGRQLLRAAALSRDRRHFRATGDTFSCPPAGGAVSYCKNSGRRRGAEGVWRVRGVAAPFRFAALGATPASRRGLLRSDPGRDLEHWEAGRTAAWGADGASACSGRTCGGTGFATEARRHGARQSKTKTKCLRLCGSVPLWPMFLVAGGDGQVVDEGAASGRFVPDLESGDEVEDVG